MATKNKSSGNRINTEVVDLAPQRKVDPVVASPSPEKKVASPKKLSFVKLKVFIASSGLKPDQSAGFEAYARIKKLGPMTIPQWNDEFNTFFSRPVK